MEGLAAVKTKVFNKWTPVNPQTCEFFLMVPEHQGNFGCFNQAVPKKGKPRGQTTQNTV